MPVFTIDKYDNITVFASSRQIERSREGIEIFSSLQELAVLAESWPAARLTEIWNSLPGVVPVKRFAGRRIAVGRIWNAIQSLKPASNVRAPSEASGKSSARKKAGARTRPVKRKNSKTARVIELLQRSGGATLKAIMRATGWQAHSVRGFISGQLGKKMGLIVQSLKRDGERVYCLKG